MKTVEIRCPRCGEYFDPMESGANCPNCKSLRVAASLPAEVAKEVEHARVKTRFNATRILLFLMIIGAGALFVKQLSESRFAQDSERRLKSNATSPTKKFPSSAQSKLPNNIESVVLRGIQSKFPSISIPVGQFQFIDDPSDDDPNSSLSGREVRKMLSILASNHLITVTQKVSTFHVEDNPLGLSGSHGSNDRLRYEFTVAPSEKLLMAADRRLSTPTCLVLGLTDCRIAEIVSNTEYKNQLVVSSSDQTRLILGTFNVCDAELATTLGKSTGIYRDLKFRALIQFNPFTKSYSCERIDFGNPQDNDWFSHTIP